MPRLSTHTLLALGLALIAIVRASVLPGPLVFDDLHSVAFNPAIRSFDHFASWFTDGQSFSTIQGIHAFRPLVLASLAVDHALFGGTAQGFRFGNLVQHVLACWLVFLVLRPVFSRAGLDTKTSERAALVGVLLFGLHPIHVETIALASARSEILATIGLLIALRGHLAHPEAPWRRAAWIGAGTTFALAAKMTGVLVPAIVVLVEVVLPKDPALRGRWRGVLLARARALVPVVAAMPVLALWYVARANAMGLRIAPNPAMMSNPLYGAGRGLATQLEGSAFFVPKAVWLWLWPFEMTIDHTEFFRLGWASAPPIAGAVFVVATLAYALWCLGRRPLLTLSVFGAFAFVLPWIVVPLNMPLAEHRMYPVAFFFGLAPAAFVARNSSAVTVGPWPARLTRGLSVMALVVASLQTVRWSRAWHDPKLLWETCLRYSPKSHFVWANLAKVASERGDHAAAVRANEKAHAIFGAKRPILLALVESRLNAMRSAPRDASFVAATARRVSDLSERWPERWRGAMHSSEFAEVLNDGSDDLLAREGVAWGLSMLEVGATSADAQLYAARAARAGRRFLEARILLEDALGTQGGAEAARGLTPTQRRTLRVELCRVLIEARDFEAARHHDTLLRADAGPSAPMDRHVLEVQARLQRELGDKQGLQQTLQIMRRLGMPIADLVGSTDPELGAHPR